MKTIAPQLKNYRWKGINSSGKKTSGNVLAMTEVEVRERLDAQHIKIKNSKKAVFLLSPR